MYENKLKYKKKNQTFTKIKLWETSWFPKQKYCKIMKKRQQFTDSPKITRKKL